METEFELHPTHQQDQARAALAEADEAERRALRGSGYPLWFWLASGLGLSALPLSMRADGAASDVGLGVGVVLLLATFLLVRLDRRVQEQCFSLGARGWLKEIAIFLPAVAVLDAATIFAASEPAWAAAVAASVATLLAWVATGLLSGRVLSSESP